MRHVLRCSFGSQHCDIKVPPSVRGQQPWVCARDIRIARKLYPQLEGICGHRVTCFNGLEAAAPDIRYFTFLRDPVRRFVSNFQHHLRDHALPCTEATLHEFAADPVRQNIIARMLCGNADGAAAIERIHHHTVFVGLTQRFDESFCLFAQWLGNSKLRSYFVTRNQAPTPCPLPIAEDPVLAAIARDATEEDQRVYQHVIDHVYPRQQHAYAGNLEKDVEALRRLNQTAASLRESIWSKSKRRYIYKPLIHIT